MSGVVTVRSNQQSIYHQQTENIGTACIGGVAGIASVIATVVLIQCFKAGCYDRNLNGLVSASCKTCSDAKEIAIFISITGTLFLIFRSIVSCRATNPLGGRVRT